MNRYICSASSVAGLLGVLSSSSFWSCIQRRTKRGSFAQPFGIAVARACVSCTTLDARPLLRDNRRKKLGSMKLGEKHGPHRCLGEPNNTYCDSSQDIRHLAFRPRTWHGRPLTRRSVRAGLSQKGTTGITHLSCLWKWESKCQSTPTSGALRGMRQREVHRCIGFSFLLQTNRHARNIRMEAHTSQDPPEPFQKHKTQDTTNPRNTQQPKITPGVAAIWKHLLSASVHATTRMAKLAMMPGEALQVESPRRLAGLQRPLPPVMQQQHAVRVPPNVNSNPSQSLRQQVSPRLAPQQVSQATRLMRR